MFSWALTGLVFFIKPGYEGAYEILTLKTYPLDQGLSVSTGNSWEEARLLKSIIGSHLLVKSGGEVFHLNPSTLEKMPVPGLKKLRRIFEDAVSKNIERYGVIEKIEGTTAYTNTKVEVTLDWNTLTFAQKGRDSAMINWLYKIHYLQWTPWPAVNQILGVLGLFLLVTLTLLGIRVYVTSRR